MLYGILARHLIEVDIMVDRLIHPRRTHRIGLAVKTRTRAAECCYPFQALRSPAPVPTSTNCRVRAGLMLRPKLLRCRRTEACKSRFHRPKPYTGASGSMNPRFRIRLGTWSRNQIRKDSRQRRMSDAPFDTQDQRFAETGASKNAAIICLSIETSGVSRQRQALPEAGSRSSQRTSLIARFSRRASRQN